MCPLSQFSVTWGDFCSYSQTLPAAAQADLIQQDLSWVFLEQPPMRSVLSKNRAGRWMVAQKFCIQ